MGSRVLNSARNLRSGLLNRVVASLVPFASRTAVLWTLGAEFAGLSSLFASVLQVLSVADFGFSAAVTYSLYEPVAVGDQERICVVVTMLRRVYRVVGAIIFGLGVAAMPFLPLLISGSYPGSVNLRLLFALYLANSGIGYYLFAYQEPLLIADQRQDVPTNIRTAVSACVGLSQVVALLVVGNFYAFVALSVAGTVASNLLVHREVRRRYPYLHDVPGRVEVSRETRRQLVGLLVNRLSNVSRDSLDGMIVSGMLGLVPTAVYGNYYAVYAAALGLMGVVSGSVQASVGNSIVERGEAENFCDLLDLSMLYAWLTGWCACGLACMYEPFMLLWAGEGLLLGEAETLLFVAYFLLINMNHIRNAYIYGNGLWWELGGAYVLEAVANLALNLVLGRLYGVAGVLAATMLTIFLVNYLLCNRVLFRCCFAHSPKGVFYRQQLYYLAVGALAVSATYAACSAIAPLGAGRDGALGALAVRAAVCVALPNAVIAPLLRPCSRWGSATRLVGEAWRSMWAARG